MKKLMFFAFCLILTISVFAGCTQKVATSTPDEVTTSVATTTETTAATTTSATEPTTTAKPTTAPPATEAPKAKTFASEYLRIIEEHEYTHGRAQAHHSMSQGDFGFYYARLIDFDYNGVPELILGYMSPGTGTQYSIYTMINGSAVCADTGSLYNHGGVDPSIILAYTENEVYFVTGKAQAYYESNYRHFNGYSFETVFSCGGSLNNEYFLDGELTTKEDYDAATSAFSSNIIEKEYFRFNTNPTATIATIDNTKATLRAYS